MVGIIDNYVSSFQDNAQLYGFIYTIGRFYLLWKICYKSKYYFFSILTYVST